MTKNRDLFLTDPMNRTIPNDGVAQVLHPDNDQEWEVLRYELSNFVCEGEYANGLERILSTYLKNLDRANQPAAWVSGFFGSGKSHFLRVLEHLWRDVEFPDRSTSRGLVKLPSNITTLLKELSTAGKRGGGLWSAAGTLGAGAVSSFRLAFLGVILGSAGLPTQYAPARFVIWLRKEGHLETVEKHLQQEGRTLEQEINNLYVSPRIARALLAVDPNLAADEKGVKALLAEQYPNREDISDEELETALRDILEMRSSTPGKYPCTLIVLDELQQYINEDNDRALNVQNVVELCKAQFESKVIIVGAGQNSLNATPALSKLMGRFTVNVALSDADVDTVIRKVVLQKAPDKIPTLQKVLESVSGEINRHLGGTHIGASPTDAPELVPDYPLLPSRRRFWEAALRAIDSAGLGGQLRTQLRMVHEGSQAVADREVGTVVPGDFLYAQQTSGMLQSGVLPREIEEMIQLLDDGTPDGRLRSRLCSLIFLISKLPNEGETEGILATKDVLADLLVDDLTAGSTDLRKRIPELLGDLVETGKLMMVGDHYLIQTKEWAEWESAYRSKRAEISGDEQRIVDHRDTQIRNAVAKTLKNLTLQQGTSKAPRKLELIFSPDPPSSDLSGVPIWIRDEWSTTSKSVKADAETAGVESATVFVFIPKLDADSIRESIINLSAAKATLETKPPSSTTEGISARQAMESRVSNETLRLDSLIDALIRGAKVLQGGGNEVSEGDLRSSVEAAAKNGLSRLYQRFAVADHASWGTALKRAHEESPDPLTIVGHKGESKDHPVCKEILAHIGPTTKKGSDVRKNFEAPPFGWPKDAIDAGLLALVSSGWLEARDGVQAVTAKQITQTKIGVITFKGQEIAPPSAPEKIEIRKILQAAGVKNDAGQEVSNVPVLLQKLVDLADRAGGDPPLPEKPSILHLEDLRTKSGNELFAAVFERREELKKNLEDWKKLEARINDRRPAWEELLRLQAHAIGSAVAEEIAPQVQAIMDQRLLAAGQDPIDPITQRLSDAVRKNLLDAHGSLVARFEEHMAELQANPDWAKLDPASQAGLLETHGVNQPAPLDVGTTHDLLTALDHSPLASWPDKVAALVQRFAEVRIAAAKALQPKATKYRMPQATLGSSDEVEKYLSNVKDELMERVKDGPVII